VDEDKIIRRVSNLLATAFLYSDSPTLIDRFANALSKEAVTKVLYDVQRVVEVGIDNNEIRNTKPEKGEGNMIEIVKEEEGNKKVIYKVFGYLPTDQDIENFLGMIEKDVYYARKAGALAMSTANKLKLSQGGEEQ